MKSKNPVAKVAFSVLAGLAVSVVTAVGQSWSEDFQSYPLGANIGGLGGWAGWDLAPVAATVSANPQDAGDLVLSLVANDDLVQQFSGYSSGQWQFTAKQFIPSAHSGVQTYLILMNNYNIGESAPKGWSVQMLFNYQTGLITDVESAASYNVSIVYDVWNDIKVMIDLEANTQSTYYNGTLVGSADWYDLPAEPTHVKGIGALDLWADSGGQGVLYDDISLVAVPEPSTAGVLLCLQVLALLSRRRWA